MARSLLVCLGATALLGAPLVGSGTTSPLDRDAAALARGLEEPLDCAVPTFDDKCEEYARVFDNQGSGGWNNFGVLAYDI